MPYADRERQLQYNRDYARNRKASGLCYDCDDLAVEGKTRCENHLRITTEKMLILARARKGSGLCVACGVEPLETANHCTKCRAVTNGHKTAFWRKRVNAVLDHYGRECVCCGETIEEFLTIDHTNNNGSKHRREVGDTYRFLFREFIKTGLWPKEFRTLCYNCNSGRWRNGGQCPHVEGRQCG